MDGVSIFSVPAWCPEFFASQPAYKAANALGWLYRTNKKAAVNHSLAGRLYLSKSNWLLLSVPNSLVRGLFDALTAPGIELPTTRVLNVPNIQSDILNAHISVMTPEEVAKIGADKINERGHMFGYSLGNLTEIEPRNIDGVSKLWLLQVSSPALAALRKSYGLTPAPNNHPFHITIAARRKKVLQNNAVSKAAVKGASDHATDSASADKHAQPSGGLGNDEAGHKITENHVPREPGSAEKPKKIETKEVTQQNVIAELLAAKAHSDAKRYAHKNDIVRRLMTAAPNEWQIDQPNLPHKGVRHVPTQFKLHVDPAIIPPAVKTAQSVYFDQFNLRNMLAAQNPISYDADQPFMANVHNYLRRAKTRGDFRLMAGRNNENYRATFDPEYRHQRAVAAFRNTLPMPSLTDQLIERHGDSLLDKLQVQNER